jgi:type IV pilus assembly protein PilY1
MSMTRQTILASRPAAMVLALSLVAGLTAPFVMLPRAKAAAAPPATCSANNANGCSELSPTPPEDTVAVPPNMMLMLDDSGSMTWNFMPDICYLNGVTCNSSQNPTSINNDALIDSSNNGVYYNPAVNYVPPPQANGTAYPTYTDMTNVPFDAFGVVTGSKVNLYTYNGSYDQKERNGGTQSGSDIQYNVSYPGTSATNSYTNVTQAQCDTYYANTTNAYDESWKKTSFFGSPATGTCKISYYTVLPTNYFQYSTGAAAGPYTVYYVAPAAQGCGVQPNCVLDSSPSGFKDASKNDISVGQNIANWFAYYHTRINMAKSGLMAAFTNLNPNYRFGYGSIDGNNKSAISNPSSTYSAFSTSYRYTDGNGNTNYIAQVYPFGAAQITNSSGALVDNTASRRYQFWDWIANESANNGTPLQTALQTVGKYYQTSQPWSSMSSDPGYTTGSTTQFACRASYTIMTTDGFWNGTSPGVGNVDGTNGPTYSPPAGKTYKITGYVAAAPYSDKVSNTLADVAMYYWENDLQSTIPDEVAPSTSDPAFWQHMTTFTMGLGFTPLYSDQTTPIPVDQVFAWAQGGTAISGFSWPTPSSNSINNIADLAHAAVNGHGDFFSVKSPQDLAAGFAKAISEINARTTGTAAASVNASVIAVGAVGFGTSYNTGDWSGQLEAAALQSDGSLDSCKPLWNAASGSCPTDSTIAFSAGTLDTAFHSKTGYTSRAVYTDAYNPANPTPFTTFQFTSANAANLDATETAGLKLPALAGSNDTLANRINYLLGDNEFEGNPFRARTTSILGAIIHSQPVYVGYPTGNYFAFPSGTAEATAAAASTGSDDKSYDSFVTRHANRAPTVYVGANDGMLHAFNAPVPQCASYDPSTQQCASYTPVSSAGAEDWAFIPRAVYSNLGNLTNANFQFRPTVDATPVTRDVFFSEGTNDEWHTLLAGGVGLGGRGVYALDITGPLNGRPTQPTVQWEFDSDMTAATSKCKSNVGSCNANDLGYTVSQPNIGRLALKNPSTGVNGTWVVLVPNGYFPDCSTPDFPTADVASCQAIAAQAPGWSASAPYSALFVLDAQTGAVIAELKTPQISGVTSFGLSTPVMGDYQNDQIDDVAFAGDAMGNLWRFDLSSSDPSAWTVTLAYNGTASKDPSGKAVIQPITSMPRLFPDPTTNRFMVVFGTGRFLGVGDNSNTDVQALYGVRDQGSSASSADAYTQGSLQPQYLHESSQTMPDGTVATLRCVTGSSSDTCTTSASGGSATPINSVAASQGGWYVSLQTKTSGGTVNDAGERVVVNPGAIFASNTVVFETLITGAASSDPCSPSTVGSIMALNALTGGSSGVSSLGGGNIAGGRINNARTSGSLPLVSALGGGQVYLPGTALAPTGKTPLSIDAPIWRRRSWNEINQNQ